MNSKIKSKIEPHLKQDERIMISGRSRSFLPIFTESVIKIILAVVVAIALCGVYPGHSLWIIALLIILLLATSKRGSSLKLLPGKIYVLTNQRLLLLRQDSEPETICDRQRLRRVIKKREHVLLDIDGRTLVLEFDKSEKSE